MTRSLFKCLLLFLLTIVLWVGVVPSLAQIPTGSSPKLAQVQGKDLDAQGRSRYGLGQFREAAAAFRQAAQGHQAQSDQVQQALSLSNLALCQQQLGQWAEAEQAIAASLALLQSGSVRNDQALAQVLEIRGSLHHAQGQDEAALSSWQQAAQIYDQLGDRDRAIENRVNQSQALQQLGLSRRAMLTLTTALGLQETAIEPAALRSLPPTTATALALQGLGEALRGLGNLTAAQTVLEQSLALSQQLHLPLAAAQLNLGNLRRAQAIAALQLTPLTPAKAVELVQQNRAGRQFRHTELALRFHAQMQAAIALYQQASATPASRTIAQLNQLSTLIELQQWDEVQRLRPMLEQQVQALLTDRASIAARINLAQSLTKLRPIADPLDIAHLLATAAAQAKTLNYPRAESFAWGNLGQLYEQTGQLQPARQLTQRALGLAQSAQAADIAYLWQWQLGRVLKAEGDRPAAIAAYRQAVATLTRVRKDLVSAAPDQQFSFRDAIEPIHRELVTLLLEAETTAPGADALQLARSAIESLQVAELVNFFREDCLVAVPEQIDRVDPNAAVFYPILLPDRLAVIVSLPGQPLRSYATPVQTGVTAEKLDAIATQLRLSLQQGNTPESEFLPPAQQLYDWLIRPVQADLQAKSIKTLVFVLDGALRNLPMAVLHDGQQYLVQRYSIALTPGLQLLSSQPLKQQRLTALIAGLTQARSGFAALPNVQTELQQVQSQITNSQVLLNDRFTNHDLQASLRSQPATIVHLATHGQFSSQLENTFILTWDDRLDTDQLRRLLQANLTADRPLELLMLSACETAAGDSRAALGLAGLAVRSGARSTIATLWQVNDAASAQLVEQFYQELPRPGISKAEALRQSQISLLQSPTADYHHPYYWAAYVLVGNWL
jgi:CHAT domain-containing protein